MVPSAFALKHCQSTVHPYDIRIFISSFRIKTKTHKWSPYPSMNQLLATKPCHKFIKFGKVKVAVEALHENQLSNSNTFIMGVKGCPPVISTFLDKSG